MRLKAIAALRAPTMAITIQSNLGASGQPPEARMALSRANGSAKTVCSNLICSRVIRSRLKNAIMFSAGNIENRELASSCHAGGRPQRATAESARSQLTLLFGALAVLAALPL